MNLNQIKPLVPKILETVDLGLCYGLGNKPGNVCVEAAICAALGLPHGDSPPCVGSAVRTFKITLNDSLHWTSKQSRAEGLRALAVAQLGSDSLDQVAFAKRLSLKTVNVLLSKILRQHNFDKEALLCESAENLEKACTAVCMAACAAYSTFAAARVDYSTFAAARAACAACSTADAADASAGAAVYSAARAASCAAGEEYLTLSAQICFDVLKEMNSPGVEWYEERLSTALLPKL